MPLWLQCASLKLSIGGTRPASPTSLTPTTTTHRKSSHSFRRAWHQAALEAAWCSNYGVCMNCEPFVGMSMNTKNMLPSVHRLHDPCSPYEKAVNDIF